MDGPAHQMSNLSLRSLFSVFLFWALRTFTTAGFLVVAVAPHLVTLRQTGARAPFSFSFRLLPNRLVRPELVQPAASVRQTRGPDPQKEKMVIFCHLRGGESGGEWDLSLLRASVHSPEGSSHLRTAPLCRPRRLLQFPFVFFLL